MSRFVERSKLPPDSTSSDPNTQTRQRKEREGKCSEGPISAISSCVFSRFGSHYDTVFLLSMNSSSASQMLLRFLRPLPSLLNYQFRVQGSGNPTVTDVLGTKVGKEDGSKIQSTQFWTPSRVGSRWHSLACSCQCTVIMYGPSIESKPPSNSSRQITTGTMLIYRWQSQVMNNRGPSLLRLTD